MLTIIAFLPGGLTSLGANRRKAQAPDHPARTSSTVAKDAAV